MKILEKHRELFAGAVLVLLTFAFIAVVMPNTAHAAEATSIITELSSPTWFDDYIWYPLVSSISSFFISIAAWFLAIAGTLFDWLVANTIIDFKTSIFDKVADGVNAGWEAFRDLANIVIIGMFTFIAISIILGNKEFGQKKMVASVLIIAILINFSLLFTKIIIDASNVTAAKFYPAISPAVTPQPKIGGATSGANPFDGYSQTGIAGAFINYMGVTSIGDTYNAIRKLAEKGGGGWIALVHGIFAMVLLGGAAVVLFYGSFLLISRAVLLIFLMITSAIAFASHLIPALSKGKIGWSAWWKSLLGSAVLAPILMILLWITLKVANELKNDGAGTLGNLVYGRQGGADIAALFSYLIILGLLFASFKLASSFSAGIGGFNFAGTAFSSMLAAPITLGSRFIAAPLMRNLPGLGGRGSARKVLELDEDINRGKMRLAQLPKGSDTYNRRLDWLGGKMKAKERAEARAKGSYNAMNTAPAKTVTKGLGIPSFLTGVQAKPHGFADTANARVKAAVQKASTLVVTEAAATDTAMRRREKMDNEQRKILRGQKEAAKAMLAAAQQLGEQKRPQIEERERAHENAKREAVSVTNAAMGEKAAIDRKYMPAIRTLTDKIADGKTTPEERTDARNQLDGVKAQRDGEIKEQDSKIKEAQSNVDKVGGEIKTIKKSVNDALEEAKAKNEKADKAMEAFEEGVIKETQETAKAIVEGSRKAVPEMAERLVHRRIPNFLPRMIGSAMDSKIVRDNLSKETNQKIDNMMKLFGEGAKNDTMSRQARKEGTKNVKNIGLRERMAALSQVMAEQGVTAQPEPKGGGAAGAPPSH